MNCVLRGQHILREQSGLSALTWFSAVGIDSVVGAKQAATTGTVYSRPQGTEKDVASIQVHKFIRVEVS
jgi:hypothetical protein